MHWLPKIYGKNESVPKVPITCPPNPFTYYEERVAFTLLTDTI